MREQDILQLRDLAEAVQVQFKERITNTDDKYEVGCEMVAFSNSRGGRLPYTGAGSGVRRALEYDPNAIFSNGIDQREITHSSNEFVITIPRKVGQVTNQGNLVPDTLANGQVTNQAQKNSNQPQDKSNQVRNDSNQANGNLVTRKLTKKEQDIRNFCSVPRTAQEIMDRLGITNQSKNRKKYITSLIEIAVLERTIPDNPNDPNQKYRRKQ